MTNVHALALTLKQPSRKALSAVVGSVLSVVLIGCQSSAPAAYTTPPSEDVNVTVTSDLVYRELGGTRLRLDACQPKRSDAPTPGVLLIHGGGFTEGSRSTGGMGEMCRALARNGLAAFSIDYRLLPGHHFPAQTDDAAAAIEWIRTPEHAAQFNVDPARVGVLGSSAGAIIAQYLGTAGSGSLDTGARVRVVASYSGVADLSESGLKWGKPSPSGIKTILGYLGCTTIREPQCPVAVPASPITHVDSSDAAMVLLASDDEIVPVGQTTAMQHALDAAGVANEVIIEIGAKHGMQLNTDQNQSAVISFLKQHL